MLIENGANIKDVQKRLGHADINTTLQVYTHGGTEKILAERKPLTTLKGLSNRSQMGFRGRPESPQILILCGQV